MPAKTYHKLVRDRIPEIIEALEQLRSDKAARRGGFEKKILLKEVRE